MDAAEQRRTHRLPFGVATEGMPGIVWRCAAGSSNVNLQHDESAAFHCRFSPFVDINRPTGRYQDG